jgi:hypothetical protein
VILISAEKSLNERETQLPGLTKKEVFEYGGTSRLSVPVSKHQDWHCVLNLNPKRRRPMSEIPPAAITGMRWEQVDLDWRTDTPA